MFLNKTSVYTIDSHHQCVGLGFITKPWGDEAKFDVDPNMGLSIQGL